MLWTLHPARNHDFLGDLVIHGNNVIITVPIMENSHHRGVLPAEDAHNASFSAGWARAGAAAIGTCAQLHQHAVAWHGVADGMRRNENIAANLAAHGSALRLHESHSI